MTIKKLKTVKAAPKPQDGGAAAPAGGEVADMPTVATVVAPKGSSGATIADRFKLDAPAAKKGGTVGRKAAMYALIAGFLSLAVAGLLTFTLYQHWEFLMPM